MMKLAREIFWFPLKWTWKIACCLAFLAFIFMPMGALTQFIFKNMFLELALWQKIALSMAGNYIWLTTIIATQVLNKSTEPE